MIGIFLMQGVRYHKFLSYLILLSKRAVIIRNELKDLGILDLLETLDNNSLHLLVIARL